MKVRVLSDLEIMQTKPASYVKLKRFDIIKAEYDGKGSFLCEKVLVDKKYLTRELKYELPKEWWTSLPNLDIIKIPENIKHSASEIKSNFIDWYNAISPDSDGIRYSAIWEAYGVIGDAKWATYFTSEFSTEDVRFQDFFDIYYFYVMPWVSERNEKMIDYKNKTVERPNDNILIEADNILNGDRNEQYNDPNESFKVYAEILKATFGLELTPVEICKVQMAIKLGRLKYKYKRDSLVDLCGYSEILNRLESNNDNNN